MKTKKRILPCDTYFQNSVSLLNERFFLSVNKKKKIFFETEIRLRKITRRLQSSVNSPPRNKNENKKKFLF